jgi:hypothetical protein
MQNWHEPTSSVIRGQQATQTTSNAVKAARATGAETPLTTPF